MFAPSLFTGFLIKRFGTKRIVLTGLGLLVAAAAIAASGLSATHFYGALILLGVGWNFGFIGATSMLASAVSPEEKSVVQGVNDTVIALASTICAFGAGAIIAGFGWAVLAIVALVIVALAAGALIFYKQQVA
jgi:predicted MFS family arabinose efflux permease